jgi:hypothetical protein
VRANYTPELKKQTSLPRMPAIERADAAVIKAKKMLKTLTLLLIFSLSFIEITPVPAPRGTAAEVATRGDTRRFARIGFGAHCENDSWYRIP